jgi:hypothetical protein
MVTIRSGPVRLPHAGGSATFFLPVAAALSPGVDVVAIQYPVRAGRDQSAEPDFPDGERAEQHRVSRRYWQGLDALPGDRVE